MLIPPHQQSRGGHWARLRHMHMHTTLGARATRNLFDRTGRDESSDDEELMQQFSPTPSSKMPKSRLA